ncbi:low temperature requirement protein A [soil metagenome]
MSERADHHRLLRTRDGHHARVGFVELFFDLVFVFAITQISHTLLANLTWLGALQAAMMTAAVWWAWIYTSWVTNWLDPERVPVRLCLVALMASGLLLSTSLPQAFVQKGLWFAIAYVLSQAGRSAFMLWAARDDRVLVANFQRILCWQGLTGAAWIGGALIEGEGRMAVWLVALALDYAGPALEYRVPGLGRANTGDWTVEGGHMAERVGLFIIICLGESLLVTGATFAATAWTLQTVLAATSAFVGTLAMWWLYFSRAHDAASEVISHADDPGSLARRAYTYSPIVIVAGIIVTAVGDELSLVHPSGPVGAAMVLVLVGGPVLFMLGTLLAKLAVFGRWSGARLLGTALLLGLGAVALAVSAQTPPAQTLPALTPLMVAGASTAILILVAAVEGGGSPAGRSDGDASAA